MPSVVPRFSAAGRRPRWRAVAAIVAAASTTFAMPSMSSAAPINPKATPLAIMAAGAPVRCPSAGEVDGQRITSLIDQSLRGDEDSLGAFFALAAFPLLPTPAVALCDPDLVQSNQPLGAFGGAAHHALTADVVFPGMRALGAPPEDVANSELVPGDRIELPPAGPKATLTVIVATGTGATSAHVAALGAPQATAVRVEGTLAAPAVVIERGGAEPTRVAVAPPPKAAARVEPRLRGRTIRFHGTAPPGTIVTAMNPRDGDGDLVVASTSGRFSGLDVRVGPKRRSITVSLLSLARRQAFEVNCTARWSASRKLADKISCKAIKAARATTTGLRSLAPSATGTGRPDPAPTATSARPSAAAAAAPSTTEASVTRLVRFPTTETPSLAGDLNGDGRPDVLLNNTYDEAPRPRVVVSRPTGAGASIPIRADRGDVEMIVEAVPDLDGDGRDELSSGDGVVITDTFAAPTLPARIDLRGLRPTSPRDLDLGVENRDSLLSSLLTASDPLGSVPDTTGDGRPEFVLDLEGLSAIFPSQGIVPGVRSRLAQVFPLAWLDEFNLDEVPADAPSDLSPDDRFADNMQAIDASSSPGSVVVGGRFVTLAAADAAIPATSPRTFLLRTYGGGPVPTATASFSATGVPLLLDHDPTSGDSLVVLFQRTSCRTKARCLDRLLRVSATGQAQSVIALRRDERLDAAFIADGPDVDRAVDVAIWRGTGRSSRGVKAAGDNGSIAVLASTQTGARQLASLPVLARGGKPIQAWGEVSSRVLPNGSRWLAAQTSQRADRRSSTGTYALLGQKP